MFACMFTYVSKYTIEIQKISLRVINEAVFMHCIEGLGFLQTIPVVINVGGVIWHLKNV